jgi:phytoene dehydrogenase-like protein
LDLERTFNLTGGNIFQGAMTLNQLFAFRPVPGFAGYRTPVRGLYLCGSAAHPGGGQLQRIVRRPPYATCGDLTSTQRRSAALSWR